MPMPQSPLQCLLELQFRSVKQYSIIAMIISNQASPYLKTKYLTCIHTCINSQPEKHVRNQFCMSQMVTQGTEMNYLYKVTLIGTKLKYIYLFLENFVKPRNEDFTGSKNHKTILNQQTKLEDILNKVKPLIAPKTFNEAYLYSNSKGSTSTWSSKGFLASYTQ